MTWQRAGLAAAVALGLTLVESWPHLATMVLACVAFGAITRQLAGRAILAGGTPVTIQTGVPAAAVLVGLALVETWPHAATLGIAVAILWAISARLGSST